MPVKPLPKKLIERLKSLVKKRAKRAGRAEANKTFWRMRNADHREQKEKTTSSFVKKFNVSRNFPFEKEIVIKMVHGRDTAKQEIEQIQSIVREHNKKFHPENYVLREPIAYDLGYNFVAMAKVNKPSLVEILYAFAASSNKRMLSSDYGGTLRGFSFFSKLQKKYGVTKIQLAIAAEEVTERTELSMHRLSMHNILLLGVNKKGQFVFMPLIDLV
jgi:hypothetical protein